MFSGIVEEVGRVVSIREVKEGKKLGIQAEKVWKSDKKAELCPGDSIAVSGVCLTVERIRRPIFFCTVVQETLKKTTLGEKKPGSRVNLERALTLQEAIAGHIVQGHVDGQAETRSFKNGILKLRLPKTLRKYLIPRGSLAVDGVSLTIAGLSRQKDVSIAIIPYTRDHTTLGFLKKGDRVNVEIDLLGKALFHYLEDQLKAKSSGG